MNYGYFDEQTKEYVITRPDTPAPWANYLGSPEYGAIISNNAGGYSFVKSGANGRLIRYRFNAIHSDQPGRYIYIRDDESKDFWSGSWQPVGKSLETYESRCHHGTAYTKMVARYAKITSETLYYVPLGKTYEVWRTRITNQDTKPRHLSLFGYVEFTNDSNYEQDSVNLQYTQFITRTYFKKNKILQTINENVKEQINGSNAKERFFGVVGETVSHYDGDREVFVGRYRSYANPIAVEGGTCSDSLNFNGNSCGALQLTFTLAPGETKEVAFLLGAYGDEVASQLLASYENFELIQKEIEELKNYWHSKLNRFQIKTPDVAFNHMMNTWNAYQCFITFIWSRAASFQYCGLRNGYGYRDTVQDIQGIIHLEPDLALEKIRFMLSAQVDNGGGLPLVKFNHHAGHENTPDDPSYVAETGHPSYRADDALWLFPTVLKYINETGHIDFLDEVIVFANGGEATVYEHLKRAIDFSMKRLGAHGMPAGLHADWNDCLRMGKKGESTFVAFQLYYAMTILNKWAKDKQDITYSTYLTKQLAILHETLQNCWEDDQFIRGIKENGEVVGSKKDPEANLWLNPQSWAVISGCATKEQAQKALDKVYQKLNTPYGAVLLDPPYKEHAFDGALMLLFNASTKENGGIFSQSQGWIILAEALMGNGNRAFEYYQKCNPAQMNDQADIRQLEPYAHGQFIEGKRSPFHGRAHVHWLTGTASTVMVACVEGILGMRPQVDGLLISPSIPSDWKTFDITKTFRNKQLSMHFHNEEGHESGVQKIFLNGQLLKDNFVPVHLLEAENTLEIYM
ncbi:N,N'-diacetylchitobiose phosphorylase [Sporanaerobium hydrogeniformans]|uniref:N,N'-diacetylchitobiose phosphorylase n=1 Tax=Sporanaerobium hydrogeniformans TaxID=3072179 RepID=A0AC61DBU7_9FIRM|nr:N,N'-diacetylchitobiose phosphorylase [Sporanaerobium hydrogeniformans]PHV70729.1 N,N'-diacetylchitobiose phosphorylase [Sporanaerobium hydrogeniformans]